MQKHYRGGGWSEWDLNSGSPDFKSGDQTTLPRCFACIMCLLLCFCHISNQAQEWQLLISKLTVQSETPEWGLDDSPLKIAMLDLTRESMGFKSLVRPSGTFLPLGSDTASLLVQNNNSPQWKVLSEILHKVASPNSPLFFTPSRHPLLFCFYPTHPLLMTWDSKY